MIIRVVPGFDFYLYDPFKKTHTAEKVKGCGKDSMDPKHIFSKVSHVNVSWEPLGRC